MNIHQYLLSGARQIQSWLFPDHEITYDLASFYKPLHFSDCTYLLSYKSPTVHTAIKANKYHRDPQAARALGVVLAGYLQQFDHRSCTIIPLPQSFGRWRERGFDHLKEVLKHTNHFDCVRFDVLTKPIHTQRQAHVTKTIRLTQQTGTFACDRARAGTLPHTVILFDDVATTGATMRAAQATLAPHLPPDARLICLAIAH